MNTPTQNNKKEGISGTPALFLAAIGIAAAIFIGIKTGEAVKEAKTTKEMVEKICCAFVF